MYNIYIHIHIDRTLLSLLFGMQKQGQQSQVAISLFGHGGIMPRPCHARSRNMYHVHTVNLTSLLCKPHGIPWRVEETSAKVVR